MIVIVFAEERSGSTWLCDAIANKLNRRHAYIEMDNEHTSDDAWEDIIRNNPNEYSNSNLVFQTHRYTILKACNVLNDPILLRTTRSNVYDQVLSYFFMERTKTTFPAFWRLPHNCVTGDIGNNYDEVMTSNYNIVVSQNEVDDYMIKRKQRHSLWNKYSGDFPNQTIVYEDLYAGVDIPSLNLTLDFTLPSDYGKLTYDKAKYFANANEIMDWVESYQ